MNSHNKQQNALSQIDSILKIVQKSEKLVAIPARSFTLYAIITAMLFIGIHTIFILQLGVWILLLEMIGFLAIGALFSHLLFRNEFKKQDRNFRYTEFMTLVNSLAFFLTLLSIVMSMMAYHFEREVLVYLIWLFNIGVHSFIFGFFTEKFLKYYGILLVTVSLLYALLLMSNIFNDAVMVNSGYWGVILCISTPLALFSLAKTRG
jgi:hypothetical protein